MGDRYPDDAVAAYKEDCKFFDPGYDDRDWDEIAVPACWQAEGHDYNGAAWYRLRFDYRPGEQENVARLSFLGVDYFADVWLNGCFLGSHEGFFNHFEFDASRWIRAGENLLVVKVDSPNDTNLKVRPIDKTIVKGALDDWDCNDLTVNPGGIFNDVRLLLSTDVLPGPYEGYPSDIQCLQGNSPQGSFLRPNPGLLPRRFCIFDSRPAHRLTTHPACDVSLRAYEYNWRVDLFLRGHASPLYRGTKYVSLPSTPRRRAPTRALGRP